MGYAIVEYVGVVGYGGLSLAWWLIGASFVGEMIGCARSGWAGLSHVPGVVWAWVGGAGLVVVVQCGWREGVFSGGGAEGSVCRVPF